jgi:hypothetical protein
MDFMRQMGCFFAQMGGGGKAFRQPVLILKEIPWPIKARSVRTRIAPALPPRNIAAWNARRWRRLRILTAAAAIPLAKAERINTALGTGLN